LLLIAPANDPLAEQFNRHFAVQQQEDKVHFSDLTPDTQQKLLAKTVNFQGYSVAFNQLIDADSSEMADLLPLAALLKEERSIEIGKPLPISSGYDEAFYIERTFNHQIAIKKNIEADKAEQRSSDLLAYSEQEFKQLCQQNPTKNIHWQQSQGSLAALREYIDTHHLHVYPPENLNQFLQQAQNKKVMLISDTAGMGKTTVLTHLSKQLKQQFPTHWVVRIDLNDHTDALKYIDVENKQIKENFISDSAIKFLSEKLLKLEKPLEQALFKQCFEQKGKIKVVLMLDGFDEISPNFKCTVIDLLQALRKTSVEQLWVTTRPHMQETLEDKLQQFSYRLQPFSEANQVEFLTKFWRQKLAFQGVNQERLTTYANALIKKLAQSISDKEKEFTGVPLQTRMLAEAFEMELKAFCQSGKTKPALPDKLDLLDLCKKFIREKYKIFGKKGPLAEEQQIDITDEGINIPENHQRLALQLLFTAKQINSLQPKQLKLSNEQLARIGIVQIIDGKPHFIHRTFAEYLETEFLMNQLKKKNQHQEVQDFLLTKILLENDYQVIRAFLNGWLEKEKFKLPEETLKQYGNRIVDLRLSHKDRTFSITDFGFNVSAGAYRSIDKYMTNQAILHQAVIEGNTSIINFLLDSLKAEKHTAHLENMKLVLLARNRFGYTAWHVAAERGNVEVLEKLWEWVKNELDPDVCINDLLLAETVAKIELDLRLKFNPSLRDKDIYKQTAWHLAANNGHAKVLEKLWEFSPKGLKKKLLLIENNHKQIAWHLAVKKGHVKVLEKLWEWGKATLNPEALKELLLVKYDGQTAWHLAAKEGHLGVFEKLLEWGQATLSSEELKQLLLAKDDYGKIAWHRAAWQGHVGVLEKLWVWSKEEKRNLKDDLLLAKDNGGKTALHLAVERGNVEVFEKLWAWSQATLRPEELKTLISARNKNGKTALELIQQDKYIEEQRKSKFINLLSRLT
jgi:ankyrin repeat protein